MRKIISVILNALQGLIYITVPGQKRYSISIIMLIAANSIPAWGIIFYEWNPVYLLIIYWIESGIIGLFNVFKMLIISSRFSGKFSPFSLMGGLFLSAFFTVHYGGFMAVHGIFLGVFLSGFQDAAGDPFSFSFVREILPHTTDPMTITKSGFMAVIGLFISHLFSFILNFLMNKRKYETSLPGQMIRPYKRIVIMHLTIILGAFIFLGLGRNSIFIAILWIFIKICADIYALSKDLRR